MIPRCTRLQWKQKSGLEMEAVRPPPPLLFPSVPSLPLDPLNPSKGSGGAL